jgi:hypothetical protein
MVTQPVLLPRLGGESGGKFHTECGISQLSSTVTVNSITAEGMWMWMCSGGTDSSDMILRDIFAIGATKEITCASFELHHRVQGLVGRCWHSQVV